MKRWRKKKKCGHSLEREVERVMEVDPELSVACLMGLNEATRKSSDEVDGGREEGRREEGGRKEGGGVEMPKKDGDWRRNCL